MATYDVRRQAFGGFGANPAAGSIRGNQQLLGRAQEAGHFDPFGSPRLRALRRRMALRRGDAMRSRTSSYGKLLGLDPMAQRSALVDSDLAANAGTSDFLNQAEFQDQSSAQDFSRGLYGGELDFNRQQMLQRQAERAARSGGLGQAAGVIGGRVLNKFLPF